MPSAKHNFLERINNFEKIVSPVNPANSTLASLALTEVEHNEKVRMLRNGMAIVGFTILEDFIKKRTGEILKEIGSTGINFNNLPDKLKDAVTVGALKGIQNRAEVLKNNTEDYIGFIQNETLFISSTKNSVFELSEYSIGWNKSNLSSQDISKFLSVFNVQGGWNAIRDISTSINVSLTNPSEIFKNAATRRHKAAHNVLADSLLSDLEDFVSQSKVIAFSFDILLSQSLKHIKDNTPLLVTNFNQLSFRFILQDQATWKEYTNNFNRAYRVGNNLGQFLLDVRQRARNNNQYLLIKGSNNQILDWY